jgi:hypothetical protein
MKATSPRRQLIVAVLLVLAVVGAGMRSWAPKPSLARDIGTLLLVLWLPVIGNIIGFLIGRAARLRRRNAFQADAPFAPHLLVELTAGAGQVRLDPTEQRCTLVVGDQGFTARLPVPLAQWLTGPQPQARQVELLRPEIALGRFVPGVEFGVHAGASLAGRGRVVEVLLKPA